MFDSFSLCKSSLYSLEDKERCSFQQQPSTVIHKPIMLLKTRCPLLKLKKLEMADKLLNKICRERCSGVVSMLIPKSGLLSLGQN